MKPSEFWNCSYREASIFVKSYIKEKETNMKNQIFLLEKATDKLIKMSAFAKSPKYISLINDVYKDLFKEEIDEIVKNGNLTQLNEQDKYKYVMELQEELKRGEGL